MPALAAAALVTALAAAACLVPPTVSSAGPQPRQTAKLTFTSSRPGSPTGVEWELRWRNPDSPDGKPPALAETVARFPSGTVFDTSAPEQCKASDEQLMTEGAAACPSSTRVGRGKLDVDTGSLTPEAYPRFLKNDVTNFNNAGQSVLFIESTNSPGAPFRTVVRARVSGTTVTTENPPLPGVPPPDPYTALKLFQLSVGELTRAGRAYVRTPTSCPASGQWISVLTFIYRDGVSQTVTSPTPCRGDAPTRKKPRIRLAGVPRRGCVARDLTVRVRINGELPLRRVAVYLDGRQIRTTRRRRFRARVRTARLRSGRHLLSVRVRDARGGKGVRRIRFRRCR